MTTLKRRLERIAFTANKRARAANVPGIVTAYELLTLIGKPCAYCGIEVEPMHGSFDHAVPLDRGGPNRLDNIVRCCNQCQRTKHAKTPQEFAEHRELWVTCALPGCGVRYKPRWAEWISGRARYHSLSCAAKSRWVDK